MKKKFLAALCSALLLSISFAGFHPVTAKAAAKEPLLIFQFENGMEGLETIQKGATAVPEVVADEVKGNVLHVAFGAVAEESTAQITNPYIGMNNLSAITMMAWVKVPATAPYLEFDGLFGFTNDNARLTLQTRPYLCWNAGTEGGVEENWIDWKADNLAFLGFDASISGPTTDTWQHYAVVIEGNTITLYVNGVAVPQAASGNGVNFGTDGTLTMLDFITHEDVKAYIGSGSFWGSQECYIDDLSFYDSALTADKIIENAGIKEAGFPLGYSVSIPTEEPTTTPEPTVEPTTAPTQAPEQTVAPEQTMAPEQTVTPTKAPSQPATSTNNTYIIISIVAVIVIGGVTGFIISRKKKTK